MDDIVTAFGPGRVNLIGEHTDYNEGLALPFAIDAGVTVAAAPTGDRSMQVIATDLGAKDRFQLDDPARVRGWRAFARGIATELIASGIELTGARLEVSGSVPRGSGLSSSAALEVALCLAMLGVSGARAPEAMDLARLCSRVENEWVGAQTGLLDQISSLFGEADQAIEIDFQTLQVSPVPLDLGGFSLVTLDSGERHANAGGDDEEADGYNRRRSECAQACEMLGVGSLRDATREAAERLPAPLAGRALHVLNENGRVEETVVALSEGDLHRVGELLNESHASLRDCYDVSTPAVERTVVRLRDAGAVGARIMGGGFGGHVLGLFPPGAQAPDDALEVHPGPGARILR